MKKYAISISDGHDEDWFYYNTKEEYDKMPIHKLEDTFKEVLQIMNIPEKMEDENGNSVDTKLSRAQLQQYICNFVSTEKALKNPDILVENNGKQFNLIGNLKNLFDFIKLEMIKRGDFNENENIFPTFIAYTDIMGYLKYCLSQKDKVEKVKKVKKVKV